MDMTDSLAVSVSALDAHRHRLNVIASNLANAQSTKTSTGGPYRRRDVVFQATPVTSPFQRALNKWRQDLGGMRWMASKWPGSSKIKSPGRRCMTRVIRTQTKRVSLRCQT